MMGAESRPLSHSISSIQQKQPNMFYQILLLCVVSSLVPPSDGFFFPKSFFRKPAESPASYPAAQQHPRVLGGHPGQPLGIEPLQGSGTDIQPALRIVNRPPPPRNNDQVQEGSGPPPGSGFHVPRDLCLACEKFPWQPVAGGERHSAAIAAASSFSQPQTQLLGQNPQPLKFQEPEPTKTIVINALGEAQVPVPLPPSVPSRRPFAIQFDQNQSGNKVNYQEPRKPQQQAPPAPVQDNIPPPKQTRPVSFQIFQAQSPNTENALHQSQQIIGMEPPPPTQEYGQPTILHPQNVPLKQPPGEKPNGQVQNNLIPPPNPLAVGTIVASQQNNVGLPQFQKIQPAKLVYQEHFTTQPGPNPQNFKVPIIPHQGENIIDMKPPPPPPPPQPSNGYSQNGNNNVAPHPVPQPNGGQLPPQGFFLQMRPPAPFNIPPRRPSPNMQPPGPMIHYGKPIHIPNNIGPQKPAGQVIFPPPQAFLQMGPPPPVFGQQPTVLYGSNRPEVNFVENGIRQQEERRPSPSGQILQVQIPNNHIRQPPQIPNNIQPVPPTHAAVNQHVPQPQSFPSDPQSVNQNQGRPNTEPATFTQETGWEIIPSIQTDLTHLFTPGQQNNQGLQGNKELPLPVPLPVPQSHPPKSIYTEEGPQDETQIKVQDVTYHEEARNPTDEKRQPTPAAPVSDIVPLGEVKYQEPLQGNQNYVAENQIIEQGQQQGSYAVVNPTPPQMIRPRPFILRVPSGPQLRPVMVPPHVPQHFQPSLSPSMMTDLDHAHQTSLLTHQYLSQANGVQPQNAFFVRPVVSAILNTQLRQPQIASVIPGPPSNTLQESVEQSRLQETQVSQGIDPRIPSSRPSQEYPNHNCLGSQQSENTKLPQESPEENQLRQENIQEVHDNSETRFGPSAPDNEVNELDSLQTLDSVAEQPTSQTYPEPSPSSLPPTVSSTGVRGSVNVEDNGNKGSYFLYYPRQVSKNPVYWVQPSRAVSQGVVRLSPQMTPVSPSVASSVVSWSRPRVVVANQFRTDHRGVSPSMGEVAQETFTKEEVDNGRLEPVDSEQEQAEVEDNASIPYGQKLGVTRGKSESHTPFDIVTVNGSDEIPQSLEESSDNSDTTHSSKSLEKDLVNEPDYGTTGADDSAGKYFTGGSNEPQGEYNEENEAEPVSEVVTQNVPVSNNLNNFESDDSDDEREDFSLRPQTTFRKPISTTVIHSPGASSFQSMKLPNFRPQRVIVHDFTSHSAQAASTGPSAPSSADNWETPSQSVASPSKPITTIWDTRVKAPKFVENDEDEDSSESINRPQGLNIQEVIASGPISTADCLTTTNSGHLLASLSSTASPRLVTELQSTSSSKGREIYFPLGSRFPGGRPSIFSPVGRPFIPVTSPVPATISTTIKPGSVEQSQAPVVINNSNRERHFGHLSSGFAASIPVPVYRRPIIVSQEQQSQVYDEVSPSGGGADSVTYIRPQANVLVAEDIYKESEVKEEDIAGNVKSNNVPFSSELSTSTSSSSVESETITPSESEMSTEKSSSFSVAVSEDKSGPWRYMSSSAERKETEGSSQKQGERKHLKVKVVQVTAVPVVTDAESSATTVFPSEGVSSTTAIPSPAITSTKIVKSVRVRQRMRSGSFTGPLRNRFHGSSRVRVVHRPAAQEYLRHFPEIQEGDKLAKEEEQEVKNALIELKKSPESIKTH